MKKSFLALSLVVLGMSLAACGGPATPTKAPATAVPATTVATTEAQAATAEATTEGAATVEATAEVTTAATVEAAAATTEATVEVAAVTAEATTEGVAVAMATAAVEATTEATVAATVEAPAATVEATADATTAATTEAPAATVEATTEATAAATVEGTSVAMATVEATVAATAEVVATEAPVSTAEATVPAVSTWTCPEGFSGQTLAVYNWADYIGETTVQDFEKLCDVTVQYEFFENNEQVISRLRQGNPGYDVTFANTYAIEIMIRDGLLEPIDKTKIPNFANISTRWLNMPHDPENEYSVPYLWGSMGVAYDSTKVAEPIDSWEDVFNHDGPVAWLEDQRAMLGVALQILGYSNSSTDPAQITEAKEYLIANSKNVKIIAADDGQALLERGEVDIAVEYSGDIYQLGVTCGCDKYVYVIPKEGSVADMAAALIPKDAPHPELAHVFIDYLNDPVVNAEIVNYVAYGTTNQAAIDSGVIPAAMVNNPAVFASDEVLGTMYFTEDVGEAEQLYNDAWDELKISIGG